MPMQILNSVQTVNFNKNVETILVDEIYSSSDLSAWGTIDNTVLSAFENFFN